MCAVGDSAAERATEEREDEALGDELTHDASAAGAECRFDAELVAPVVAFGELEVRDIGTRDQEHGHDRSKKNDESLTRIAYDGFFERRDVHASRHVRVRVRLLEPSCNADELRRGSRHARVFVEASDRANEAPVSNRVGAFELIRRVQCRLTLGVGLRVPIASRQNTDHVVGDRIHLHRLTDDRGAASVAALPEVIGQNDRGRSIGKVVGFGEQTTAVGCDAQGLEKAPVTLEPATRSGSPSRSR